MIDNCITPFEKIEVLKFAHKQIKLDIKEHLALNKYNEIPLNGDIIIASVVTALINNPYIENAIANSIIIQYFSYVNYSISEVGMNCYKNRNDDNELCRCHRAV